MTMSTRQQQDSVPTTAKSHVCPSSTSLSSSTLLTHRHAENQTPYELESHDRPLMHGQTQSETTKMIAHDLNNLLTAILGSLDLAALELPSSHPVLRHVHNSNLALNRAIHLVERLEVETSTDESSPQPLYINSIVDEAIRLISVTLPSSITIHKTPYTQNGWVMGNATQIYQVVSNLLINAVHALKSQDSGTITLSITNVFEQLSDDTQQAICPYLRLSLGDSGPGISDEMQLRIFDPFFSRWNHRVGSGLGLAIVHDIVKKHGGFIAVESKEERGTTFHVYLPVVDDLTSWTKT